MREITGTVTTIIYQSEDGYTVAEIEGEDLAVVVGNMPKLSVGESVRFFGAYKTHSKYGEQFAVESYQSALPSDLNDIALFLAGGFIKGLGEVLAGRIVEEFGGETFDVIENQPMRLAQVKGVSKKLAQSVSAAFGEYSQQKYVYADLMGMGLTPHQANLAVTEMGGGAAAMIRENPYILIDRVRGIDFILADRIAMNLGIAGDSTFRIQNGILNVLNKMLAQGNMYTIRTQLTPHVAQKLGVEKDAVERCLLELCKDGKVVIRRYSSTLDAVFLKSAHRAESNVSARLFAMSREAAEGGIPRLDALLEKQQKEFDLTDEQAQAVKAAVESRVCVITGGPGTGKTTILKAVLNILGASGYSFALAAPTGRAAKRMVEATGAEAKTLHRLLEYSYDEDAFQCYFRKNEEDPLDMDAVIVDEVSMLDIFLFNNLLRAVKEGARLVLVGDADQLPSVGPGNVMRDILSSGAVPHVRLNYRFRNAGGIADAAYEILNGKMPEVDGAEFELIHCATRAQAAETVCQQYEDYLREGADVQVIAPIKRTETGTVALNAQIRDRVNPHKEGRAEIAFGDRVYRVGDRVMQIKNNYGRAWHDYKSLEVGEGVFNGDIGYIVNIAAGRTTVRFEDGKVSDYELMELAELEGAFAYTIHKSQGSEFEVVIIPMKYEPNPFFTRNLLYTGVTRARRKVVLVGDTETLYYMIQNSSRGRRATGLKKELDYLEKLTAGDVLTDAEA